MTDLHVTSEKLGIKYFLICYADLTGTLRSKLVPRDAITEMAETGAAFAGFATWLNLSPADPDVFAIPDPDSLIQLPWRKEVGWLAADPWINGAPLEHAPRNVLKRVLAAALSAGYHMKTGVEPEYFLISPNGDEISDRADVQEKPCYDQQALMRRFDVIAEICEAMQTLGWGPYQNDHEDANGQFETNWHYDDAIKTSDRHLFFKYLVKTVADNHGFRATFMPKPFAHLTGNGCHMHVSLWDTATNLFLDADGELGLSKLAYHFIGGLMHSAESLCAMTNPTVNSYKRVNAAPTSSGATWSPNTISYSGNNRTHMIRIPEPGRFEFRLPDGAANPYLIPAAVLSAGLDGIKNARDPGKRLDINMYTESAKAPKVRRLPLNLLDAVRAFESSTILRSALGADFITAFAQCKYGEWQRYCAHLSDWERRTTLDC